jgi:hypothetical protein
LLLLYWTSWQESEFGTTAHRSWKGYDFGVLNKLEEDGLITQSRTAKSIHFTNDEIEAARKLEEKFTI